MNATAIRDAARVIALIAVLIVAAVLGLAVGTALNGRSSSTVGAPAPGAAPEQLDYFQRHSPLTVDDAVQRGDASLTRPTPR